MALFRAMDVSVEPWGEPNCHLSDTAADTQGAEASVTPAATYFASEIRPAQQRADTPCPAVLREADRRGASFVLLQDGAGFTNRRFIKLGAGTTVVSSGRQENPFGEGRRDDEAG